MVVLGMLWREFGAVGLMPDRKVGSLNQSPDHGTTLILLLIVSSKNIYTFEII